jgi:hypothetical protein
LPAISENVEGVERDGRIELGIQEGLKVGCPSRSVATNSPPTTVLGSIASLRAEATVQLKLGDPFRTYLGASSPVDTPSAA